MRAKCSPSAMRRGLGLLAIAAGLALLMPSAAGAQSPTIKQRQDIFGAFGDGVKEPGAMLRDEAPFDLARVQASLKDIADKAPKLKTLFPDDSRIGNNTEALPAIWEEKDPFLKLIDKLAVDAKSALAAVKDEATFKTEWGKVSANCRACHKVYRQLPKS
jgi:cytochrome c556